MNLIQAVVQVRSEQYEGPAVVLRNNGDDTVTVVEEVSGHEFRVHKDNLDVAPVTEQSVAWIAQQLLEAWQPFLVRLARHLAEQLQSYGCFGASEEADRSFRTYLAEPSRAFRSLCRGRINNV